MQRCSHLALNDEGFVFDPTSGDSYLVNHTGLTILRAWIQGKEDEEVVRLVAERFAVALVEAEGAVADFSDRLRAFGLA